MFRDFNTIITLFLLFFITNLYPQKGKYRFEYLSTEQGLSQNQVNCILQDSKGFLWIGTSDGLNRYDGYNFKVYRNESDKPGSLSHNEVETIYDDMEGILWVGTLGGGLNKFDRETETFFSFKNDKYYSNSISSNSVMSIYEDVEGTYWIGTNGGGLNKFDRSTETFTSYMYDSTDLKSISYNSVYSICEDRSGNFWIGTYGGGLNKFDKKTGSFTHYKHNPKNPKSISSDKIYTVYEDKEGIIWIGTYLSGLNKLVSFNEEDGSPEFELFISYDLMAPNSLGNNTIWTILEDKDSLLWIGTQWGLNICDKQNIIKLFRGDGKIPENLNFASVYSLYEDNSGILWIGTMGGGLNKINKNKIDFAHYQHNPLDDKSLGVDLVHCFYEFDDSTIWIGTGGAGLNVMNRNTEEFISHKHDPEKPRGMIANMVKDFLKDRNGVMWLATAIGFYKLLNKVDDPEGPIFEQYFNDPDNPKSLSSDITYSICEDGFGELWIGTANGISKLTLEEQKKSNPKFIVHRNIPDEKSSLSNNIVNQIFEDKSGEIWIATKRGGLNKYNRQIDNFIHYKNNPDNPQSISSNYVLCIYESNAGNMWLGTGNGLNYFNRKTNEFKVYNQNDGLAGNTVFGILEDDKGNLWLSTNNGISKFNPAIESFKNYDKNDGLQKGQFRNGAYLKLKSGEFLFGGINGFNLFHPDSIKENKHIPPIIITDFKLSNISVPVGYDSSNHRTILETSITEARELELNHDDKVISFEFAALDFYIPEKNKYAYMLEGFDDQWNYADASRRLVTYTNLDPGEYVFKVKGSNNDGYWNEEGASMKLIILPPWWQTSWAYLIYVLLILGIIYFTWKTQLKRVRLRHEIEMSKFEAEKMHEVDEMKSRFFANISHEFRTPLTLILGPVNKIIEQMKEGKTKSELRIVHRNAKRLHSLVNQLLDLSKLESGKMKLETSRQNIIPLLKGLILSFSSFAERKKITLNFNSEDDEILAYIDKDKIEKIVTNLLSNAFKFTPEGGRIDFNVIKRDEELEFSIKDSGIGIAKERLEKIFDRFYQVDGSHTREQEGTGLGLALSKELIELHKGKIKVESEEGKGSLITVTLPIGKKYLKPEEIIDQDLIVREDIIQHPLMEEETLTKEENTANTTIGQSETMLLIVEDNHDVRNYIKSNIEESYRIIEAIDGEDGLSKATDCVPDLIISDVMMPKMDGFEMCKRIKTDERTSHIPVIMLTAKATSRGKIEGFEIGADDYIMKPFDAEELKARIKNLIEIRRNLQEKFSRENYPPKIQNRKLSKIDEEFMKNVLVVIENHIAEEGFSIEKFESEFAMSRAQIYRKLKAITGKSPSRYIRSVRLAKAKKMITAKEGNISEIAYSVGFNSPTYFSKCFKDEFGYSPSELDS